MNYRPLLPEYNWLFLELSPSFLAANSPDTMSELPLPGGEALALAVIAGWQLSTLDAQLCMISAGMSLLVNERHDRFVPRM